MSDKSVALRELILVPSVITLAVTLLRLVGELQGWSPRFFSKEAGGGAALVGIAWLVFVFGAWFAWKLIDQGHFPPAPFRPLGYGFLGLAISVASVAGAGALGMPFMAQLGVFAVASLVALFVAMKGWPALGRVLVAYGLAARIPVIVVMLVAMIGNWGTHYDVNPPDPDFPAMGVLPKWFLIGVVPQLTAWMAFTVVFGMIVGGVVAAIRRRKTAVAA
jgi:hypothetical protein